MHNINYKYFVVVLNIAAYRKHKHSDYTYKTVHTVCTATKLATSTYCNYNSRHSSQRCIDCILSPTITIAFCNLRDFCNFSKVDYEELPKYAGVLTI